MGCRTQRCTQLATLVAAVHGACKTHHRFFRVQMYVDVIVVVFDESGLVVLADVIRHFQASFAKWRWNTCSTVVVAICKLEIVRPHWALVLSVFGSLKDRTGFDAVCDAFGSVVGRPESVVSEKRNSA